MFDQRGAVLDPVAVVEIERAGLVADAAAMDVAADMAVVAARARAFGDARLEILDETPRGADAQLDAERDRAVVEADAPAQPVADAVERADEALHRVAHAHK